MKGLVPNSELQFLVDGREVKNKGLTESCPDVLLPLGDNADCLAGWLKERLVTHSECNWFISNCSVILFQGFPEREGT